MVPVQSSAVLLQVVFKHLRNICDRSGSDHVVALCSRLLPATQKTVQSKMDRVCELFKGSRTQM